MESTTEVPVLIMDFYIECPFLSDFKDLAFSLNSLHI